MTDRREGISCAACSTHFMKNKDIIKTLRNQSEEIAREGHAGWGNTMTIAADEMENLERENARLREEITEVTERAVNAAVFGGHLPTLTMLQKVRDEIADILSNVSRQGRREGEA